MPAEPIDTLLATVATEPLPSATELACVADAPVPIATAPAALALALLPSAMAVECVATALGVLPPRPVTEPPPMATPASTVPPVKVEAVTCVAETLPL